MFIKQEHKNSNLTFYQRAFSLVEISLVILLIGILIAGITKGMDLYKDVKIINANNLTKKSRLARIKEVTLWLDASDIKNFECHEFKNCSNGNKVKVWFDINKNNNSSINIGRNSGGNNSPTLIIDGINNLPSIEFNQDYNQYLSNREVVNSTQTPIAQNNPYYTMIVVWKPIKRDTYPNSPYGQSLVSQGSSVSMTASFYYLTGSITYSPLNNILFWNYGNARYHTYSDIDEKYASIMIVNNDRINFYHNSLLNSNHVISSDQTNRIGTCEFTIGIWACRKPAGLTSYHGLISEVAVIDRAINDDEAKDIMSYLSKKWGITLR